MQKTLTTTLSLLAAGMILLGSAEAQQAPAAKTPSATSTTTKKTPAAAAKAATAAKPAAPLTTTMDKFSYALGMNLGANLHKQAVDVDPNILLRGLKDALAGGKTQLTEEEAHAALLEVQNDLRKKMEEKMKAAGETNKKDGDAFLAANKSKDGVVALPSGLQYKILTAGTGPKPTTTDMVVCNYRGTLLNGTEFDSSYKRGEPATFPIAGVIKGWTEALPMMPVGSKWQLFIPADLAYGERSPNPDVIPPNSTLIFEVELLSIKPKTPAPDASKAPEKAPDKAPDAAGDKK
jgi:FKBP-type peptidyl-prolyl cis-trans isomerase FklB